MLGFEFGPCRLPQQVVSPSEAETLRVQLQSIGVFDWHSVAVEEQH
jgi:hypothetical protein